MMIAYSVYVKIFLLIIYIGVRQCLRTNVKNEDSSTSYHDTPLSAQLEKPSYADTIDGYDKQEQNDLPNPSNNGKERGNKNGKNRGKKTNGGTAINSGTTENNDGNSSENTNAIVAALVTVSVVLAIIVAMVIAVFTYRRFKFSLGVKEISRTNAGESAHEYNYPDFSYHVSNTDTNQLALNSVEYNYPDFSMPDDLKSTTSGNQRTTEASVYDKLDDYNVIGIRPNNVAMETYDHKVSITKTCSSDDITYNLSMSTGTQLQRKIGGYTDNVYNIEKDVYNKLGGDKPEVEMSPDNLYGSKQMELQEGVFNPALEKDGAYDSTCKSFELRRFTDNPYSRLENN